MYIVGKYQMFCTRFGNWLKKQPLSSIFWKFCYHSHIHLNCTTMHVYYYSCNVYRYNTTAIFFESFMIATMIWLTKYLCHKLTNSHWFVPFITCCKHFSILSSIKRHSSRKLIIRRTDNTMAKGKRTKWQINIYKTLNKKLKIEQHELN